MKKDENIQRQVRATLAKILAGENIRVRHSNVREASFDLQKRLLTLPIWKDTVSKDVYTMLIGHEVSHALYSPREELEKAMQEAPQEPQNKKIFHRMINIFEDARIERMILVRYPGLAKFFNGAYKELRNGHCAKTWNKIFEHPELAHPLDKINLYFKAEIYGNGKMSFFPDEEIWVERAKNTKTFQDVVQLSKDFYQFCLDKQINEPAESEKGNVGDEDENQDPPEVDNVPSSSDETAEELEKITKDLIDENVQEESIPEYATLPRDIFPDVIDPYENVHKKIKHHFEATGKYQKYCKRFDEYRKANEKIVTNMATIFEMKKKAQLYSRSQTSKSGVLDTRKAHNYKFSDDIFKKVCIVPEGKCHGLVMFIDLSGSMHTNMKGTLEQTLNLVLFCRKVNIPFDVYGFSDNPHGRYIRYHENQPKERIVDELSFTGCAHLKHYFSNKMTNEQFRIAGINTMAIMDYYEGDEDPHRTIPFNEELHNTPLNFAAVQSINIINEFRKKNHLDIVNAIFLTDGSATDSEFYRSTDLGYESIPIRRPLFLTDTKSRKVFEIEPEKRTESLLKMVQDLCDVNVIGLYISNYVNRNFGEEMDERAINTQIENYNLRGMANFKDVRGYSNYYIVKQGQGLTVTNRKNISVNANTTKEEIKKIQMENMIESRNSRIFINALIENIS